MMMGLIRGVRDFFRFLQRRFREYRVARQCGSHLGSVRVGGPTSLTGNTHLGQNANFNGLRINGRGKVVIGDNFHSGRECLFITDVHNFDGGTAIPYDNTYIVKDITIKDNVWLGTRVIVLGGVTIGEGAIIQAGSCVVSDIPDYAIAGGHPARVFSQRDQEHYDRLKKEGAFN